MAPRFLDRIKYPSFVEDLNNILSTGEVPGLFAADERAECIECTRPLAKQAFGKKAGDMNGADMYAYFVRRCRANLHLVLAFSPIGPSDFCRTLFRVERAAVHSYGPDAHSC